MEIQMKIQHWFNPLHIMCRLIDAGFSLKTAKVVSRFYEKHIYRSRGKLLNQEGSK